MMRGRSWAAATVGTLLVVSGCSQAPQSAAPQSEGTQRSATPASQLVGRAFPAVPLRAWGGTASVDAVDVVGNRVVNLWASWCTTCREEFALMSASPHAQFIIALNVSDAAASQTGAQAGQSLVDSVDGAFPVYVDVGDSVLGMLGLSGLPVTLAVDERGRIVDVQYGALDESSLERLSRAAAR